MISSSLNREASGPKHSIGLLGCLVSGVSIPIYLTVCKFPLRLTSTVSPSMTLVTRAGSLLSVKDVCNRVGLFGMIFVCWTGAVNTVRGVGLSDGTTPLQAKLRDSVKANKASRDRTVSFLLSTLSSLHPVRVAQCFLVPATPASGRLRGGVLVTVVAEVLSYLVRDER